MAHFSPLKKTMKKILLYTGLLLFTIACGSDNSTPTENPSEATTTQENTNASSEGDAMEEAVAVEEVAEPSVEARTCDASETDAYLDDPDLTGTNIRNRPGGDVIMQLVKDDINIEFFLTLTEAQDGWFKLKSPIGGMEGDIDIPNGEGWIHGSVISADTRNYGGQTIELLDSPEVGTVVGTIEEEVGGLKILDMCGLWVKVEYDGIAGWIERDWLCGNPLTTCS